jgi:hypothetical protein
VKISRPLSVGQCPSVIFETARRTSMNNVRQGPCTVSREVCGASIEIDCVAMDRT